MAAGFGERTPIELWSNAVIDQKLDYIHHNGCLLNPWQAKNRKTILELKN